jgi:hypothetical protein
MWTAIIVASAGCYLLKLAGLSVPAKVLDLAYVRRLADLIPVALLGALVAVETLSSGESLAADARLFGVGAAILALCIRAPFLVVVVVAATTTAIIRLVA